MGCLACGGDVGPHPQTVVRDSADVRLVEHSGPLEGAPLAADLRWQHGHGPDDYPFGRIVHGALRSDGGAVVADAGNGEVLTLDSLGRPSGLLAGSGQGPGEVRRPRRVLVRGDTTWVEDLGNTKIMRFEGRALAATLNSSLEPTLARSMMPLAVTDGGGILMHTSSFSSRFEQAWLDGHVARLAWATLALDTVASYAMMPRRPEAGINPFAHSGMVAGYRQGFVQARTDEPALTWRNAEGGVAQIVRWRATPAFPTAEDWTAFEAWLRAELRRVNPRMGDDEFGAFVEGQVASYSMRPDEPLPYFGQVVASSEGDVWISPWSVGVERPTRYMVMSRSGEEVRVVSFPRPVTVLFVEGAYVLGVVEDEFGVQAVAVYRVAAGAARSTMTTR
jgi:hypothetical protein